MFSENNKISLRQLQMLLLLDLFGTSVIILPRISGDIAGSDGWLIVLIAGVIMAVYTLLLNAVAHAYPEQTFVEITKSCLTKPVGILLSIGFAVKIILTAGLTLRIFCEIIRQMLLPTTPLFVTGAVLAVTAMFAASKGFECRGRLAELLTPIMFIPFLFIFVLAAFHTDYSNLKPMFHTDLQTLGKGAFYLLFTFQGLDFLLLTHPYLVNEKKAGRSTFTAVLLLAVLMGGTTLLTIARFGEADVKSKLWPVLQMMDSIDFPGSFLERQDIFMMWFWIISAFANLSAGVFFPALITSHIRGKHGPSRGAVFFAAVALVGISLLPPNIRSVYQWLVFCNFYLGGFYLFVMPILLFLLVKVRKKVKA